MISICAHVLVAIAKRKKKKKKRKINIFFFFFFFFFFFLSRYVGETGIGAKDWLSKHALHWYENFIYMLLYLAVNHSDFAVAPRKMFDVLEVCGFQTMTLS